MKKLLADLFAKKEKSRHAAAAKKPVRLPRLRDIHFRSIRARGMFVGSGLVLLAIVISLAAYTLSLQAYYYSATRASLQAKAETASAFLSSYVDRTYAEFYQRAFNYAENFDDKDSLELQFVNTEGRVEIASTGISAGSIPGSDDIKNALDSGKISFWQGKRASTGEKVLAVSAPLVSGSGSVVGVMRYITSLKLIDRAVNTSSLVAGGIGLVVLAIVVFSNLYFLRTITEPIASLTGVARRIAEGSYGAQVEKTHDDEIGELTDAINDMSQKLSQAERVQTEFISSVSHELRTPLTSIRRKRSPTTRPSGATRAAASRSSPARRDALPKWSRSCSNSRAFRTAGLRCTFPRWSCRRWSRIAFIPIMSFSATKISP